MYLQKNITTYNLDGESTTQMPRRKMSYNNSIQLQTYTKIETNFK
jgi:hypothetical protein